MISPHFLWRHFKLYFLAIAAALAFSFSWYFVTYGAPVPGTVSGVSSVPSPDRPGFRTAAVVSKPASKFTVSQELNTTGLSARSILVIDLATLTPLYERAATVAAEPASTSKLVTALVALKLWPENRSLIVPASCLGLAGDNIGLTAGEVISLKNLLYGMLLNSATDATCVVYSNVGGITDFAVEMNKYVAGLGLSNTIFGNPVGFDGSDSWEGNITTANDLSIIAAAVLKNPTLRDIVGTKNIVVTSTDGGVSHNLTNTNELLGVTPGVYGVKTGTTDQAGQCLITALKYNDNNFIIIVLGSSDRYVDTRKIIQWLETGVV